MRHALIQNSWQLILTKVSKGFHLSFKCWYNQNGNLQQFLSHYLKQNKEKFLSFNRKKEQLDVFLFEYIGKVVEYGQMWKSIQFILMMFHGQADVKRGFNVNKELLVENIQEVFLIS